MRFAKCHSRTRNLFWVRVRQELGREVETLFSTIRSPDFPVLYLKVLSKICRECLPLRKLPKKTVG